MNKNVKSTDIKTEFSNLFFTELQQFLDELIKVFPEFGSVFTEYLLYISRKDPEKFISEYNFIQTKYIKQITEKDEKLFDCESIYLLRGINFVHLWKSKGITNDIKNSIWSYLQLLYLISKMYNDKNYNKEMLMFIKKTTAINAEVKENKNNSSSFGDLANLGNLSELANLSSKGIKISKKKLKEASKQIKELFGSDDNPIITELLDDIISIIKNHLANNNKQLNIMNILSGKDKLTTEILEKIKTKIESKVNNGELTDKDMLDSANKLFKNLTKGTPMENTDITSIMEKIKPEDLEKMTASAEEIMKNPDPSKLLQSIFSNIIKPQ